MSTNPRRRNISDNLAPIICPVQQSTSAWIRDHRIYVKSNVIGPINCQMIRNGSFIRYLCDPLMVSICRFRHSNSHNITATALCGFDKCNAFEFTIRTSSILTENFLSPVEKFIEFSWTSSASFAVFDGVGAIVFGSLLYMWILKRIWRWIVEPSTHTSAPAAHSFWKIIPLVCQSVSLVASMENFNPMAAVARCFRWKPIIPDVYFQFAA